MAIAGAATVRLRRGLAAEVRVDRGSTVVRVRAASTLVRVWPASALVGIWARRTARTAAVAIGRVIAALPASTVLIAAGTRRRGE